MRGRRGVRVRLGGEIRVEDQRAGPALGGRAAADVAQVLDLALDLVFGGLHRGNAGVVGCVVAGGAQIANQPSGGQRALLRVGRTGKERAGWVGWVAMSVVVVVVVVARGMEEEELSWETATSGRWGVGGGWTERQPRHLRLAALFTLLIRNSTSWTCPPNKQQLALVLLLAQGQQLSASVVIILNATSSNMQQQRAHKGQQHHLSPRKYQRKRHH